MGASDKFKGENEPAKGGEYYLTCRRPSIAIAECRNASTGGEKDHRMGFWVGDIMTRIILKKN